VVHTPVACAGCGASLAGAPVTSTEAREVFDLPQVALRVVEHLLEHRRCGCGRTTMAAPPARGRRAGPVRARGARAGHLPARRPAPPAGPHRGLLGELVGAPVSDGSLAGWYADAAAGLDGFDAALREGLADAPVLGADETGIRVDGALAWVPAARTDT
jgi:hypothetical protein